MTPISEILSTIGSAKAPPAKALRIAVDRADEAAPALLAVLDRAAAGKVMDANESNLVFFGLHVLAAARVRQACAPLLRLLRRPDEELEDLLGDATTTTLPQIVASVFDGNADALFDLIGSRKVDPYTRWSLFGGLTYLSWTGDIARDRAVDFLGRFLTERLADEGDVPWCGWLDAIGLLGLEQLAARAEENWALFPANYLRRSMLREMVADAVASPDDVTRFERDQLGRIDDVVQSLAWLEREPVRKVHDVPPRPASPPRLAGRNDPCPCGSGKKYKKCCIGKVIEAAPAVAAAAPEAWPAAPPRPGPARR